MNDEPEIEVTESLRSKASQPSPADIWVGHRVRMRRQELGLALVRLADDIGISKNQLMKFEAGENRVTCGRLYDIGRALSTAPGWFFEKFPGSEDLSLPDVDIMDLLMNGNSVDVVRLYNRLTAEQQKAIRVTLENLVAGNEAIADAAVQAGE